MTDVEVQWNTHHRAQCPGDADISAWAGAAIASDATQAAAGEARDNGAIVENTGIDGQNPVFELASDESESDSEADLLPELTVRVVDREEIRSANHQWRNLDKPTNVLSFPSEFPPETGLKYYGDILICAEVVAAESVEQGKDVRAHWAHITIHGTLHLLGYDHIDPVDAEVMERREIEILATLGFSNPYISTGEAEVSQSEVSKI